LKLTLKISLIAYLFCFSSSLYVFAQTKDVDLKKVDELFKAWNNSTSPGGAIGIIKNGKLIYSHGYGMADLENDVEISSSSTFYIGSVSKQFVSFCILLLEEAGKLSLDDKVQKHLPDFPDYSAAISIRNLIHHTSGVRDFFELQQLQGKSYLDYNSKEEVYRLIKQQKELNFRPGEKFLYSNSCYFLLALIIEKVSGRTLKEYAHSNIFEPLNMSNTNFHDNLNEIVKNKADSYEKTAEKDQYLNVISRFDLVGSGGIYSNISDLFLWDQNFYQNKLGKGSQLIIDKMHEEGLLNNGESSGYAFALFNGSYKGLKTVHHAGGLMGYRAEIVRFPDHEFTVIILANRSDANPSGLCYQIADIYLKNVFEKTEIKDQNATTFEMHDHKLKTFCGSYFNHKYFYSAELVLEKGVLNYKSSDYETPLIPISASQFQMKDQPKVVLNINEDKSVELIVNGELSSKFTYYEPIDELELVTYVGAYWCSDLAMKYELRKRENSLALYVNNELISSFKPLKKDEFYADYFGIIKFNGTDNKDFVVSNAWIINLKFERTDE